MQSFLGLKSYALNEFTYHALHQGDQTHSSLSPQSGLVIFGPLLGLQTWHRSTTPNPKWLGCFMHIFCGQMPQYTHSPLPLQSDLSLQVNLHIPCSRTLMAARSCVITLSATLEERTLGIRILSQSTIIVLCDYKND